MHTAFHFEFFYRIRIAIKIDYIMQQSRIVQSAALVDYKSHVMTSGDCFHVVNELRTK